jgi:hypothetical protein
MDGTYQSTHPQNALLLATCVLSKQGKEQNMPCFLCKARAYWLTMLGRKELYLSKGVNFAHLSYLFLTKSLWNLPVRAWNLARCTHRYNLGLRSIDGTHHLVRTRVDVIYGLCEWDVSSVNQTIRTCKSKLADNLHVYLSTCVDLRVRDWWLGITEHKPNLSRLNP